jgi:hypothetical protein
MFLKTIVESTRQLIDVKTFCDFKSQLRKKKNACVYILVADGNRLLVKFIYSLYAYI